MYEVPGSDVKTVHISADCVRGMCAPEFHYHNAAAESDDSTSTTKVTQPPTPSDEEESAQVRVKQ